eukprot:scaffold95473_cov28-Tisochrysis_lutea.AAC.2
MHFKHITHRRIGTHNPFPDRNPLCRLCAQANESSTHIGKCPALNGRRGATKVVAAKKQPNLRLHPLAGTHKEVGGGSIGSSRMPSKLMVDRGNVAVATFSDDSARKGDPAGGEKAAEVGVRPKWIFGGPPADERGGSPPSRARGRTPPTRNKTSTKIEGNAVPDKIDAACAI